MQQQPETTRAPHVGDVARVKETGRLGTVVKLKGVRDQRFRLAMIPDPALAKARDQWYGLDELEFPV
jgi:hypothetical protein